MLAAYYSPMTIQEISIELGVALPYLEDEIKLLVDREYLVCIGGKYLTNIPIFTLDCTKTIDEKLKELINESARKFVAVTDEFDARFENRFANTNLARWQKVLMCMHFALMETENTLKNKYGKIAENRKGVVWGRSFESSVQDNLPQGIQGIYNGCESSDKRGSVIAMNFRQTLNAQHFEYGMTDPIVCTAVDCFEYLPKDWQKVLDERGYAKDGTANFAVWSYKEYEELKQILHECISVVTDLNRKTAEIAANITSDFAPSHIRQTAEYVGALVYRFYSIDKLVSKLFEMDWINPVADSEKPAICVVKY